MPLVEYPTGVIPPKKVIQRLNAERRKKKRESSSHKTKKESAKNQQPSMKNYDVKPVIKPKMARPQKQKRHSKYNAHRIYYDHHWFDSKTECGFYIYLKSIHAIFRLHVKYVIKTHHVTPNGIPIRQRNYTPDFVRYKDKKALKENKPYEVDDIKGIGQIPSYDSMRFGAFEDKYDIPVVIIRWQNNHWTRERKCF